MNWKNVQSRIELADYICDLRGKNRFNEGLDDYLEALAAVVSDYDGFQKNLGEGAMDPDEPAWSTFAHMLSAATVYE